MTRFLHSLSAALFHVLAGSLFLAYVLFHNGLGGDVPRLWLNIGDLPLLVTGLIYGGLSVYRSLTDGHRSRFLAWGVALPLAIVFILALLANFWPVVSAA